MRRYKQALLMTVWWSECSLWLEPLRRLKRRRLDFFKLVKMSLLIQEVSAGVRTTEEASCLREAVKTKAISRYKSSHQPSAILSWYQMLWLSSVFWALGSYSKGTNFLMLLKISSSRLQREMNLRAIILYQPSSQCRMRLTAKMGFFLCLHFSTSDLLKHVRAYMEIQ